MPQATVTTSTSTATLADGQQVISGVAVGTGDVTKGLSGDRKVWTEEELKQAADSLAGGDIKALHSETTVGEVTDAGYVEGTGVVYQGRIDDEELAEGIANGRLTVSIEARHDDGGSVETARGEAMKAADIRFSDLAIVQHGAAPSASAEPGEAAALTPAEIRAALEEDPASTEGDPSDIDISDTVEEGLKNKVEEHNGEVGEGKQVTLGQLKKVYRRGAGAWFSSNKGATQNQWAYARVNEALKDIKSEKAINHGNDNDIFEDSVDYDPPDEERSAALVEVNGTEVDLEAPPRVKNAIEAAMDAKEQYSDEIGDCGTGVGEEMGQTILDDELTPEIITSGGDIAQYGPATYLDGHGDEGPATDDPPTDWGREEWLGIGDGGSSRCGPVQLAMWGYYLDWFESAKQEVEAAMEDTEMADDMTVPEEYRFSNPGEAVEEAKYLGVGEDRDLAGDEMIHTHEMDGETVFMPGPTHEDLLDRLRERGELAAVDVALPMPSESVQLLYPEQSVAADAARAMGLGSEDDPDGDITHPHDFEGETWYMPGADHDSFVDAVSGMGAGMAGLAPVAKLNEYKAVGPITFRGTREGELDESQIPNDEYEGHYFNAGETKSDSSFPLVDGEGYLRRGNLDAAWDLRGQGDLGMPRDSAERLMLNLGLVFGPPDSEANPLPQEAYADRDDVGTPYAEEATRAADVARLTDRPDDPETGEVPGGGGGGSDEQETTMSDTSTASDSDPETDADTARLGGDLADLMRGEMVRQAASDDRQMSQMMQEMADAAGMSRGHMHAIKRGEVGCPSMDAIEAMSDILGVDTEMLVMAAERDGCDYSAMGYGSGSDDTDETESMTTTDKNELKAELADAKQRIEELEQENEQLRDERDQVAQQYAEALADGDTVLDAEDYVEKFEVSELAEMYDEAAEADLASEDVEPTVRSGSDGTPSESSALSAGDRERVAELEDEREQWAGRDSRLAEARLAEIDEELDDLRGDN
jgi:transcriptional regulator with XRE-family HTH domain